MSILRLTIAAGQRVVVKHAPSRSAFDVRRELRGRTSTGRIVVAVLGGHFVLDGREFDAAVTRYLGRGERLTIEREGDPAAIQIYVADRSNGAAYIFDGDPAIWDIGRRELLKPRRAG